MVTIFQRMQQIGIRVIQGVEGLRHSEPLIRITIEMAGVSAPPPMPSLSLILITEPVD